VGSGREIMLLEVVIAYFKITRNLCEGSQDNKEIARSIATNKKVKVKVCLSSPLRHIEQAEV